MRLRRIAVGLIAPTLVVGALATRPASADAGGSSGSPSANTTSSGPSVPNADAAVCSSDVPAGYAYCHAHVRTDSNAVGHVPTKPDGHRADPNVVGNSGAYDPMYLQSAYDDPAYRWQTNGLYGSTAVGSGQLVAIVDAYDASTATSDLANYRSYFGLPACPLTAMPPAGSKITAEPACSFYKVNQSGVEGSYPSPNSGWAQEISLDVDMVSAMCPNCSILLVEANSNSMADLGASVNKAVSLGAAVVSNSYGGSEYSSEINDASLYYSHLGVAVVASSGDNGYGVEFPAAAASVTAVGGTTLSQATNTGTRNGSESAWSGAGSGCSAYVTKPDRQKDAGCLRRTVADVSAVADPNTGVWVYDRGWYVFGGTSVASPIIGSMFAVGNALNGTNGATPEAWPYGNPGALYDVTSGSNGSCSGSYLCTALSGYDGPTGLGTPLGSGAFTGAAPAPTVPSAPSNLRATAGDTTVSLSWSAPTDSGGSAVTYKVYRSSGNNLVGTSNTATPIMSGLTAATYTDTGLTDGTQYNYEVVAVNSSGPSLASNEASATPAPLPAPPGVPVGLTAVPGSPNGVTLTWTVGTGGSPTSYNIYRGTRSNKYTSVWSATPSGCSTTCNYTDTSAKSGTSYYYRVAAVNSAGTSSKSNQFGPVKAS